MLLTDIELKQQVRQLWEECFQYPKDFIDIFFEEKYKNDAAITFRPNGYVVGSIQVLPYRMTYYGMVGHVGYLTGLAMSEAYRGKGMATQLVHEAHRKLFKQGAIFSFVIPSDAKCRSTWEQPEYGAYWTAAYRKENVIEVANDWDRGIEVSQPDVWGDDLFVFYRRYTQNQPFMLHPAENDFYAALAACDQQDGVVLVARRKRKLVGVCLAVLENGRCMLRSLLGTDEMVKDSFVDYLKKFYGVDSVYAKIAVPGSVDGATPYAMARVINVENFLNSILKVYPTFQMHIGVDGDLDIPENNGYYLVDEGKVTITDQRPDSIVTPGGLAAMFLAAHPTSIEMMLDE